MVYIDGFHSPCKAETSVGNEQDREVFQGP